MARLLDRTGRRMLRALQRDARISFSALGREVGLSAPAVAERVRRMEEAGVIQGYYARLSAEGVGRPVSAFLRLTTAAAHYPRVLALAAGDPEVLECHHVSGESSFVMVVAAASLAHLEALIARFSPYGATATSIVLSSPVVKPGPAVPDE
jgi:Lrp/AsnC family leucine-responsive transcriptional regulator